jgi:hypothetical protein
VYIYIYIYIFIYIYIYIYIYTYTFFSRKVKVNLSVRNKIINLIEYFKSCHDTSFILPYLFYIAHLFNDGQNYCYYETNFFFVVTSNVFIAI